VFHLVVVAGARYKIPVKKPKVSPLTVLASDDTESKALDLNIVFTFGNDVAKLPLSLNYNDDQ
jgi:hypothetical protein